jgi:hypothetical protein
MIMQSHKKWRLYYRNGLDTGGRVLAIGPLRLMFDIVGSYANTKTSKHPTTEDQP